MDARTAIDRRDLLKGSALAAAGIAIAFFGLAFARARLSLVFVGLSDAPGFVPLSHGVFDLAYTATALAVFLCSRRLVPVSQKTWVFATALAGMLTASTAFALAPVVPQGALASVQMLAAVMGGVAFLMFTMLNAEILAGVSLLRAAVYTSGNGLLGSVLAFFLSGAGAAQTARRPS